MTTAQIATWTARSAGTFLDAVVRTGWRDRWLYAVALVAFVVARMVALISGAVPDIALAAAFLIPMIPLVLLVIGGLPVLDLRLKELRDGDRSRRLFPYIAAFWREQDRALAFVHALTILTVFSASFAAFKSSIAVLSPFSWDVAFAEADRLLHFGYYPHDLLMPIFGSTYALFALNVVYHLWFFFLIMSMFIASQIVRDRELRQQFILSFMLTWFVGGFIAAMVFSSAGPCYFERVGLGDIYVALMAHLHAANEVLPLAALEVQDYLWKGFTGELAVSSGIAAFPSMHVAIATVMALGAYRINRKLGYFMWGFVSLIQIGSVMLGWHYAVDGYAGALLSVALWKLTGFWARRIAGEVDQVPVAG